MDTKLKTEYVSKNSPYLEENTKHSSQNENTNAETNSGAESEQTQQNSLFKKVPDLWNSQEWHEYHSQLRAVSLKIHDEKGWSGFDAVFMISALDGDGVSKLKVGVF